MLRSGGADSAAPTSATRPRSCRLRAGRVAWHDVGRGASESSRCSRRCLLLGSGPDDPVALRATKHIQWVPQRCRVERCHAPADASTTANRATVRAQHDRLASPSMRELAISAASSSASTQVETSVATGMIRCKSIGFQSCLRRFESSRGCHWFSALCGSGCSLRNGFRPDVQTRERRPLLSDRPASVLHRTLGDNRAVTTWPSS